MLKQKLLRIVNLLMFIDLLIVVVAQIVYHNHPELQGEEAVLEVHEIAGAIFILLVIVHIILNFSWIKNMYFKRKQK